MVFSKVLCQDSTVWYPCVSRLICAFLPLCFSLWLYNAFLRACGDRDISYGRCVGRRCDGLLSNRHVTTDRLALNDNPLTILESQIDTIDIRKDAEQRVYGASTC